MTVGGRPVNSLTRVWAVPATRALLALVLVLVIGCIFNADGAFYKIGTHRDALRQASVFGILACGMTLVIISGGIDLAVGSMLALASVSFSLMTIHWGWSPWLAFPLTLCIGMLCGAMSGGAAAWFGIQPFIATLAMMVFARGLAKTVSGGMKVSTALRNDDGTYRYVDVPAIFRFIDSRILGGNVSVVTVIFLVCALVTWIVLTRHRWGRQIYAIGGNEEAARLSGVPVAWTKLLAYAASGLLAGVAGICQAAQEQQGDPEAGAGLRTFRDRHRRHRRHHLDWRSRWHGPDAAGHIHHRLPGKDSQHQCRAGGQPPDAHGRDHPPGRPRPATANGISQV